MTFRNLIIVIAGIMLVLFISCSNDEDMYPTEPNSATGVTDASGEVDLDLGSHIVTVSVVSESGSAVANITVTAYLLKEYLLAFAGGSESHYASFTLV